MQLKIINDNDDILILPTSDKYILQEWSGFAYPTHSIATAKAPNQDGATVIKKNFDTRTLDIQFAVTGSNRQQIFNRRKEILNILNPAVSEATLKWIQNDGTTYKINVEIESVQMPGGEAQGQTFQIVQVSFLAPSPFWKADNETIVSLVLDTNTDVVNDGDIKVYPVYEIFGPVTNPTIYNHRFSTEITINGELKAGESYLIFTEFGNKDLYKIGTDGNRNRIMNLLDLNSVLSPLKTGINAINFTGNNTTVDTGAEIRFNNKFIGV